MNIRVFILLILIASSQLCFAQKKVKEKVQREDPALSPQALHDLYIKKRNEKRLFGWTLIGAGTSMVIGGYAKMNAPGFQNTNKSDTRLIWLPVAGILTAASGIPLLSSAKKFDKKADAALQDEEVFIAPGLPYYRYPAIALRIKL
jgi:hypothetical protein